MDLLAHMDTFVRIVDAGSLTGAARSARVSLPAVSRHLSALEEQLGTVLVVRSTRRLAVTDAGRTFYEHARAALREAEEAMTSARSAKALAGRVTVSAPVSFGLRWVVPRLERLALRHPRLRVDLHLEDAIVDLVARGVDVAVRAGMAPPDSSAWVAHPLVPIRRLLVAAPAYLDRAGVPREPSDLAKHDALTQVGPHGGGASWRFARGRDEARVEVRANLRSTSPSVLVELARGGLGLAVLPDWLVESDLAAGRLRRVLPAWETPLVPTWLLHRTELRSAARVRAFVEAMRP